ncbi:hypothetical protein FUA48_03315 [Flavobacterium alkalisoli]|uniref:Uncharacterized protein n=1 Tax=Flavobacterium alkalisoli TaxID=2602769 RepID=A0A5B9FR55_9FLAO|nr:hypothetical protein [Flavobacterium alkalisoli]QEE48631.1 hypothetical protein FUA48_03315 [Flavobacterium alkalisoli]
MKKPFAFIALLASAIAFAQSAGPVIPQQGKTTEDFVPKGWKIISSASGDLNKDKAEDIAMVIENTDSANFVTNENFGSQILNLNPRYLLILFKDKKGYILNTLNKSFIPSQNDIESPCLEDPLAEAEEMSITKGVLSINFHTWMSCGSYGISRETFRLRYQDNRFVLIGYDLWESSRNIGDITEVSINFLTGKKSTTTGEKLFDDNDNSLIQTTWEDIETNELINLANLKWPNEIEF